MLCLIKKRFFYLNYIFINNDSIKINCSSKNTYNDRSIKDILENGFLIIKIFLLKVKCFLFDLTEKN